MSIGNIIGDLFENSDLGKAVDLGGSLFSGYMSYQAARQGGKLADQATQTYAGIVNAAQASNDQDRQFYYQNIAPLDAERAAAARDLLPGQAAAAQAGLDLSTNYAKAVGPRLIGDLQHYDIFGKPLEAEAAVMAGLDTVGNARARAGADVAKQFDNARGSISRNPYLATGTGQSEGAVRDLAIRQAGITAANQNAAGYAALNRGITNRLNVANNLSGRRTPPGPVYASSTTSPNAINPGMQGLYTAATGARGLEAIGKQYNQAASDLATFAGLGFPGGRKRP